VATAGDITASFHQRQGAELKDRCEAEIAVVTGIDENMAQ